MLQEFVSGLSVLSRGNLHEKLLWTFSLYDTNGDGIVTKDEMLDIVTAIYDLMGNYAEPSIDEHTARDHVERVFQVNQPLCIRSNILFLSLSLYSREPKKASLYDSHTRYNIKNGCML